MLKQSFAKSQRLLTAPHFKAVLTTPQLKITNEALIAYALVDTKPRLGLAIARKYIKKAVQRNSVKRVIRESFRLNYAILPNTAVVIVARTALVNLNKQELRITIELIWLQLRKKFPELAATV